MTSEAAATGATDLPEPTEAPKRPHATYWLTRFVLLRLLGFVYLTAFLVAAHQMIPLVGHDGLTPADLHYKQFSDHYGSLWSAFWNTPDEAFYRGQFTASIFFWNVSDAFIQAMAWTGVALSAVVMCGFANSIIMLVLWGLYMSVQQHRRHVAELRLGHANAGDGFHRRVPRAAASICDRSRGVRRRWWRCGCIAG